MLQRVIFMALLCVAPLVTHAGILELCVITGELRSEAVLEDDRYVVTFVGSSISAEHQDFCKDRLGTESTIELTERYFASLGSPGKGTVVTLREYREENDFGHGLMRWRYFDFGFNGETE